MLASESKTIIKHSRTGCTGRAQSVLLPPHFMIRTFANAGYWKGTDFYFSMCYKEVTQVLFYFEAFKICPALGTGVLFPSQ